MQFGHVGLTVSNLDRSAAFYKAAFGFESFFVVERKEQWISDVTGYENAHLKFNHMRLPEGGMHLELVEYIRPGGSPYPIPSYSPGHVHFCLHVSNIEHWILRALDAGAKIRSTLCPTTITDGPNKGAKIAYLRDHDYITIELFEGLK